MTDDEARQELMETIEKALAADGLRWTKTVGAEGREWVTRLELTWREDSDNAAIASAWTPYPASPQAVDR